jgi:hypothetical protein
VALVRTEVPPKCWFLQEPHGVTSKEMEFFKDLLTLEVIIFSKIFEKEVKRETDLQLEGSFLRPPLNIGLISAYFGLSRKMPEYNILLLI